MPKPKEPVALILLKGNKHLTKKEIEERKEQEIKAPADKIRAPSYLPKELKKEFKKISDELVRIEIMSNLDVDALARFLMSQKMYLQVSEELLKRQPVRTVLETIKDEEGKVLGVQEHEVVSEAYGELLQMQDKLFKQCRAAAGDLGLTISSRCRLVVPKPKEKPETEFDKRFGEV
ncbi:phage terminase small subunit P27 family [Brevibacillus borstelensis]|uniref:phage terminase small subunit P27 family n=1 Tax=Brevibacillus borstelensis TaxID=45462 RepID=UPI00057BEF11|nr:phage terminase small subunit P27 family [Brevibacillus borstelensis]MED1881077.1 phage terminase small subunit P27 family [Brevibacillus borstelensis]MED2006710.1 phage terminase small subunit P27 family [Brevibacillus borstelensis]RNB66393.1 phage terminase small subunit P27 family [Brevibacillus borstelensis]GED53528.1 hypothetical protein BBO01nite_27690 [Brevibacillus borstelensis]